MNWACAKCEFSKFKMVLTSAVPSGVSVHCDE